MKYFLSTMLSLLMVGTVAIAQDNPSKMMRKADRSLSKYNLDQANNKDELMEAKELIDEAVKDDEVSKEGRSWVVKGQVYEALTNEDMKLMMTTENAPLSYPDAPYVAHSAYKTALEVADRSRYEQEALQGLMNITQAINMVGNQYLNAQEYDKAYRPLSVLLDIHETLVAEGEDPIFNSDADYQQQRFVVAICAVQAGEVPRAKSMLMDLYKQEYSESAVYSTLFDLLMKEGNEDQAIEVLEKGQELFPNDSQMLFAKINYYIQNEEYDKLEESLKKAIEAEPENASVRSALGNVYMKLFNDNYEQGNTEEAQLYKNEAIKYYREAIDLDNTTFEPYYSIGSMYFNEGAVLTQKMSELGMSKEDQKKYDSLKQKSVDKFAKALPYFKKAEQLNPNDESTLIALKEIFARQNDFESSNAFKSRLEEVRSGKELEQSYYEGEEVELPKIENQDKSLKEKMDKMETEEGGEKEDKAPPKDQKQMNKAGNNE